MDHVTTVKKQDGGPFYSPKHGLLAGMPCEVPMDQKPWVLLGFCAALKEDSAMSFIQVMVGSP
jgi:hypothetical protein